MYAVIRTGGKQLKVSEGDVVQVERVSKEKLSKGDAVAFSEVLAIGRDDGLKSGSPLVDGAKVSAVVVREMRGPKLLVFKKKRRKQYRRLHGHRQDLVEVKIQKIEA